MTPFLAMLNGWEVVALLAVVLVIFGAKKLPELARGLGQGIKEFKKSSREIQDEISSAIDLDTPPPPPRRVTPPEQTTPRNETITTAKTEPAPQSSESVSQSVPQSSEPKA